MFIDARTFTDAAADGKLTHKTFVEMFILSLALVSHRKERRDRDIRVHMQVRHDNPPFATALRVKHE